MIMTKKISILISFVFLISACGPYQEITVSKINDFKVTKVSASGIEGEIYITINNPNSIGFTIFPSSADITYGDVMLGRAYLKKKVKVGAKSAAEQVFSLKGSFKDVTLTKIFSLFSGGNKMMEVKGYLRAGKWFYKKRFPLNQKERVKNFGADKGILPGF